MKLDVGSLLFNINVSEPGGTPSWGTALGQNKEYKFDFDFSGEFIKGMLYKKVNSSDVQYSGRPGSGVTYNIELAAVFEKVFFNDIEVSGERFVLFINKEDSVSHKGRKSLKYSPEIYYQGNQINKSCFDKARTALGISVNGAWFVVDINIKNQDELHCNAIIVDADNPVVFGTKSERKNKLYEMINACHLITAAELKNDLGLLLDTIENTWDAYRVWGAKNRRKVISLDRTNKRSIISEVTGITDQSKLDNIIIEVDKGSRMELIMDDLSYSPSIRPDNSGMNKIFYGTPGCGKSYKVKNDYCGLLRNKENNYIRTIFHPDYTNTDFVGQLLPIKLSGGGIDYVFKTGPFTDALILAYNHLDEPVYLIIEELNRGNSAAIFGELFQLLDRNKNNESEYGIHNHYITEKLNEKVNKIDGYFYDFDNVKIPSNLSIIATMNTSDQNVYPLDTAFQRRWKMEKIRNNFFKDPSFIVDINNVAELDNEANYVSHRAFELARFMIPGTKVTWREFVIEMNKRIIDPLFNEYTNDDKQIGIYFLSEDELEVDISGEDLAAKKKNFAEKMLKYIWDDIAKLNPDTWFEDGFDCLDKVLDGFNQNELKIFKNSTEFKEIE